MILTPYARVIYTSTGVVQNYNVPFPYLDFDHIHIYAIDPDTRKRTTEYAIAQWVTGSRIRPLNVPPLGQKFMIERVTPRDAALVDYANGAVIEAEDLDLGVLQNLYICEELIDELEWTGNEVSLLWTAYSQLKAYYESFRAENAFEHTQLNNKIENYYTTLNNAIASLRATLEDINDQIQCVYTCAQNTYIIAHTIQNWLHRWYDEFLPYLHKLLYVTCVDGKGATVFEEDCRIIMDGCYSRVNFSKSLIYDGMHADSSEWFSWTPEALELMKSYQMSSIAMAQSENALHCSDIAMQTARNACGCAHKSYEAAEKSVEAHNAVVDWLNGFGIFDGSNAAFIDDTSNIDTTTIQEITNIADNIGEMLNTLRAVETRVNNLLATFGTGEPEQVLVYTDNGYAWRDLESISVDPTNE